MKKVFNKALCAVLLLSLVFSSFSLIPSTVSADNSYTYEEEMIEEVVKSSGNSAEKWKRTILPDSTDYSVSVLNNSLTNTEDINVTGNSTAKQAGVFVPLNENGEEYDYSKISKVEVTGIYNDIYATFPIALRSSDNNVFTVSLNGKKESSTSRIFANTTENGTNGFSSGTAFNKSQEPLIDDPNTENIADITASSIIKAVFETYSIDSTRNGVIGKFYNVSEGNEEKYLFSIRVRDARNLYLYPGIAFFGTTCNIQVSSLKITYSKTVDATADVEKTVSKYITLTSLSSIADITKANAATVINEINNFTAEFNTLDSKLQNILLNADVYNADRFAAYKSYAQNLINGVIGQYFDTDVSTGKKVDDLWSVRGNVTNITVSDGSFKMNATAQELTLTNGLSTAPKSMVIKAKFADNTDSNVSAGLYLRYAQLLKDTNGSNSYFWFHIPSFKNDEGTKLVTKNLTSINTIRGSLMKINSTDAGGSWAVDGKITYPEGDDAIVIGNYVDGVYVPNTVTTKIDYVLNEAKDKYFLTFTISDPEGHSATYASKAYIPNSEDVSDYGLTVSGMPYDNNSNYKTVANYGEIESIEYLMAGSDITAPTLDGVKFKDITTGTADIAFRISSNAGKAPEGYTPVAYGAYIITNAKLNNAYDIINADYTGKGGLKVIQAQKEVSDGKVPDTYLVSVAKSAAVSGETSYRGYRFAAVGYVTYADESGNTVTVYTGNTDAATNVILGQGNRSVVGIAKLIAANEIKNGAIDTDNKITNIINKTTATTVEEQYALIKFVCDNQSFIEQ